MKDVTDSSASHGSSKHAFFAGGSGVRSFAVRQATCSPIAADTALPPYPSSTPLHLRLCRLPVIAVRRIDLASRIT